MITKFDNRYSPLFRWNCESLLDESGNNLHLSGSPVFREVYKTTLGLSPPVTLNRNAISDAILRDYNDLTIQIIGVFRQVPSSAYILAFQASGETEATDYTWSIVVSANTVTYFSEHGAGLDTTYAVTLPQRGLPAVGVPWKLDLRLLVAPGGGGLIAQFFLNGKPFGPPSGVLTPPTGGTSSQLVFCQTGVNSAELIAVEINSQGLTDAQLVEAYNRTMGDELGYLNPTLQSAWVGALTTDGATVAVNLAYAAENVRLVVSGPYGIAYTSSPAISLNYGDTAKFTVTGLDADTHYAYWVEVDEVEVDGPTGSFHTLSSGADSFVVAFSGDAFTGSNHAVFNAILEADPLMFIHMGDAHYHNINVNDPAQFQAAFNEILAQPRQAALYRNVPTAYVWDDHDFGANNCDASSPSKPAAAAIYRTRVPHYPLPDATSIYQTFDIGRVRFILTDQRSAASADSATDNSSKSMLGAAQKTWFKNLLSNSAGMLIVWVCPRWFGTPQTAGADSWGGFSTERAELAAHIHSNCSGRVLVLSADVHGWGIDNGTNHDFLSGGGEPLRCFQASPLDIPSPAIAGTYSEGSGAPNGVFGTMAITDTGGSSIDVEWAINDSTGAALATYSFTVSV